MPQTLYGNQVGSETLRAGKVLTISVDAGGGAIVEQRKDGRKIAGSDITASTAFGPFVDDTVLVVSAKAGATVTVGDPVDQVAQRPTDSKAAAVDSLVSEERITTWSNRATLVSKGFTTAFFTDVGIGGSYWDYLGGRWRPQARQVVLKNLTSSVTQTTNVRQVMDFCTLPAGLWQDGDILECRWYKAMVSGTDTDTTETAIGTGSGTFGTALGLSTAALTNTNPVIHARYAWRRVSATTIRHASIGGSSGAGSAGTLLSDITGGPDLDALTTFPQLSGVLTTGAGAVSALRACTWTLICGA